MIPLSSLSAGRRNPRKADAGKQAHRRLVASIRSVGLLHPLIVRPASPDPSEGYVVIAGRRRLQALRTIYRRSSTDPKIKCEVETVDTATADTMSLAENFAAEGMHPLDEAEAFARLAHSENKGVSAVAAEFGVTPRYVRQRMKLSGLGDCIKTAYRSGEIDTETAEVFSTIPPDQQCALWEETNGQIRHAQHAKNLIEHQWIDARHGLFDPDQIPDAEVSRDLFGDRILIERQTFMHAQAEAISAEAHRLKEEGWDEVVIGQRDEVFDRLHTMAIAVPQYGDEVQARLEAICQERQEVERTLEGADEDDEATIEALYNRLDALDEQESTAVQNVESHYSEEIKAAGTVFLILHPDGQVGREYRIPRTKTTHHVNGYDRQGRHTSGPVDAPPTSEDISDRQQQAAFAHETIAVRSVLLGDTQQSARSRRILLALMLSESGAARGGGLLIRREADPIERYVEIHTEHDPPFSSETWQGITDHRSDVDPLDDKNLIGEGIVAAYLRLQELSDEQLDRLIDLLIVQAVSGSLNHHNGLIVELVQDLGVELRDFWTPDAGWFTGYRKIQLAHLIGELRGKVHGHAAERMKKSELVESVSTLFAKAKAGEFDDAELCKRINEWLPSCVRLESSEQAELDAAA
jgi:ParB family chromosome partitioning protein